MAGVPTVLRWGQAAVGAITLMVLPLPMMKVSSCDGKERDFTGLQWAFGEGAPFALFSLGTLALLVWWGLRRRADDASTAALEEAGRFAMVCVGAAALALSVGLGALFARVEWFIGGRLQVGGWGVLWLAAAVAALWPLPWPEGGGAPSLLRSVSRVARWALVLVLPVVAAALWPMASAGVEPAWQELQSGVLAAWAGLALPGFSLARAGEHRMASGGRGGSPITALSLALVALIAVGVTGGLVTGVLDILTPDPS